MPKSILIAGIIPPTCIQRLLTVMTQNPDIDLTVYTPAAYQQAWPTTVTVLTGDLTEASALQAAALDQDVVFIQLDSKALIQQTQSLIAALNDQPQTPVLIASPDSILSLAQVTVKWYRYLRQRRQLAAVRQIETLLRHSALNFTLVEGTTASTTALYSRQLQTEWITALPIRRRLSWQDYLMRASEWPTAA